MSVIEYLLEQQAVVLSLAAITALVAGVVLLLAGVFTMRAVRRVAAARQQRRAEKLALAERRQRALAEQRKRQKRSASRAVAPTQQSIPSVEVQAPPPVAPPAKPSVEAPPAASTTTTTNVDTANPDSPQEADPEIQSILDSVFVDDEANARFDVLMRGVETPPIEALADFADSIARQLVTTSSSST